MTENSPEETGDFRIKLPRRLWEIVKTVAPWLGMNSSEVTEEALQDWLDRHDVSVEIDGNDIVVKEVT